MGATVTIDKSYFETLLRRAEFHATDSSSFLISKTAHGDLMKRSCEYDNLRSALILGGVTSDTLDLLARSPPDYTEQTEGTACIPWTDETWYIRPSHQAIRISGPSFKPNGQASLSKDQFRHGSGVSPPPNNVRFMSNQRNDFSSLTFETKPKDSALGLDVSEDDDELHPWTKLVPQQKAPAKERHTVLLSNLPKEVMHKDVTAVVRGGRLVDVWLQRKDCAAAVSFASGAKEFLAFASRNPIVISGKLVEVSWSERQFDVPTHLVTKLSHGVSRNLVIRGGAPRLSEEQIRNDMDHINNLVIIGVVVQGPDIYISTNSINNAMFARTCMTSRKDYKGLKIQWYPDECDEPLPASPMPAPIAKPTKVTKQVPPSNRFDLLDDSEGDSESEDLAKRLSDGQSEIDEAATCLSDGSGVALRPV